MAKYHGKSTSLSEYTEKIDKHKNASAHIAIENDQSNSIFSGLSNFHIVEYCF